MVKRLPILLAIALMIIGLSTASSAAVPEIQIQYHYDRSADIFTIFNSGKLDWKDSRYYINKTIQSSARPYYEYGAEKNLNVKPGSTLKIYGSDFHKNDRSHRSWTAGYDRLDTFMTVIETLRYGELTFQWIPDTDGRCDVALYYDKKELGLGFGNVSGDDWLGAALAQIVSTKTENFLATYVYGKLEDLKWWVVQEQDRTKFEDVPKADGQKYECYTVFMIKTKYNLPDRWTPILMFSGDLRPKLSRGDIEGALVPRDELKKQIGLAKVPNAELDPLMRRAESLFDLERWKEAEEAYREIVVKYPNSQDDWGSSSKRPKNNAKDFWAVKSGMKEYW